MEYLVFLTSIPRSLLEYIARKFGWLLSLKTLKFYDDARVWNTHIKKIRDDLNIKPDKRAHSNAIKAMEHAAWAKEEIVDVLNVGAEERIHLRYELPKFDQLLRLADQW